MAQHSVREPRNAAVIFDLDGVLIDSEGLQYQAYAQVLGRFGVTVTRAEYAAQWIGAGRGPEYAVAAYALPLAPDELRALKAPVYRALLHDNLQLMPGARAALTRLQPHYRLALATNSDRQEVDYVLSRLALTDCFMAVVARQDYARRKPEPDAFVTAAARLGVAPPSCLVVEDAYRGVVAGRRAGAVVAAVPNEWTRGQDFSLAAVVLDSLDALTAACVARLLAAPA